MFKICMLTCFSIITLSVTAHAETRKYTQAQIDQMPRFSSIENMRCPSARYTSVKKRLKCKQNVRIKLFEKREERKG